MSDLIDEVLDAQDALDAKEQLSVAVSNAQPEPTTDVQELVTLLNELRNKFSVYQGLKRDPFCIIGDVISTIERQAKDIATKDAKIAERTKERDDALRTIGLQLTHLACIPDVVQLERENAELRAEMKKDDERLHKAELRTGCEDAEQMADTIELLSKENAELRSRLEWKPSNGLEQNGTLILTEDIKVVIKWLGGNHFIELELPPLPERN